MYLTRSHILHKTVEYTEMQLFVFVTTVDKMYIVFFNGYSIVAPNWFHHNLITDELYILDGSLGHRVTDLYWNMIAALSVLKLEIKYSEQKLRIFSVSVF